MTVFSRLATGLALTVLLLSNTSVATKHDEHNKNPHHNAAAHHGKSRQAPEKQHHAKSEPHHAKNEHPAKNEHHGGKPNHKNEHHQPQKHDQPHHNVTVPAPRQNNNCKTGLGWTDNDVNQGPFQKGSCWCYNWSPWPCSKGGVLEEIPMLWSMKQIGDWETNVKNAKPYKYDHILCINEPNETGQSNMSPQEAVNIWWAHVQPVKTHFRGSPAVTTSQSGFVWLQKFLQECKGCSIAFITLHYYGTSVEDFKTQITRFHKMANLPVWVTEWACQDYSGKNHQCSQQQTTTFLRETKQWMDGQSWIQKYAYYGAFQEININPTNRLMSTKGALTELGKLYLGWAN